MRLSRAYRSNVLAVGLSVSLGLLAVVGILSGPAAPRSPERLQGFASLAGRPIRTARLAPGVRQIPVRLVSPRAESSEASPKAPWQNTADTFINIDATPEERIQAVRTLFERRTELQDTLRSAAEAAIQKRDLEGAKNILYPTGTEARRVVDGLDAVQRQVREILPELTKPDTLKELQTRTTDSLPRSFNPDSFNATKVISGLQSEIQELTQEIQAAQSNPEKLRERIEAALDESKNVFRRTPTGLEMPNYTVLASGEGFEIREYDPYTVAATPMTTAAGAYGDALQSVTDSGKAFNTLASYIFGQNQEKTAMAMTAPVEMTLEPGVKEMAFVLPSEFSEKTPTPEMEENITIKRMPSQILAVREFPGFATDKEIESQKAALIGAMASNPDYAIADATSFRVLQWNPPYTLPWLRRNEICTKVLPVGQVVEPVAVATPAVVEPVVVVEAEKEPEEEEED